MKIRIKNEIVKEIDGVRRTLTVGQVIEIRDPDAASLIRHGYAEPFPSVDLVERGQAAAAEAATTAAEPTADSADDEPAPDDKPGRRGR